MTVQTQRTVDASHIANTQDTNDPVIRLRIGESFADVIIATESECLNVWYIQSEVKGDMKRMLDFMVTKTGLEWIQFIAPLDQRDKKIVDEVVSDFRPSLARQDSTRSNGRDITDAVDGFENVVVEENGKEIPMLVGFWDTEQ